MVKLCAKKITSFLLSNEAINLDDYELYKYGFETLIAFTINISIILIISFIAGKFKYTLLFLGCYCPTRQYTGGYHAENYKKCLGLFIIIYLINIMILDWIKILKLNDILLLMELIGFMGIWILAPIEHREKPLTHKEILHYKTVSRILTVSILILTFIGMNFKLTYEYSMYASSSIIWIFIMLNLAIIKDKGGYKYGETFK
ncbi:accessory gene regulator ArgB-like protein [Paraclostridium sordellii]|uniref:accessory gene regulator ArgB-like protein n=1 Tax=Paraclostridium sordellii TaxID=1505 RepID=UPI00189BB97E|nr:accessory gene regulator B family protein [Paeniclostridium sordellii]MCR1850915.1 accessory gene regulator B family protein [Paeniclostridium sordellii]